MSEIKDDNDTFRFDSEYVEKRFLKNIEIIKNRKGVDEYVRFGNIIKYLSGGATPLGANYPESGVPFFRVQNIMQNYINDSDVVFINKEDDNDLKRSRLVKNDVLLTITGVSYGKSAVVTTEFVGCNINQHSVKITLKDNRFSPFFISTFLNAKNGKLQSDKNIVGITRPALDYKAIKTFVIPILSNAFQLEIEKLVKSAHSKLEESKALYAEAEKMLLDELGLSNWQPSTENVAVKSFKESFLETGRLDAEFYQPKYDYALRKLKELKPKEIVPLESLLTTITNGQTPLHHDLSIGDVTFLTAEHISDFRLNFDSDKRILTEHHQTKLAKTQLKQNDLLITIKGKVGNAVVVEDIPKPTNINQDVGLLRFKDNINPYFIAGYINSILGRMFVNQICTGQINPFLGLGNLRTIPIPIFDKMDELGNKLKQKLVLANKIGNQSKQLLELAKRAVEVAIEQDENAALTMIKSDTL